jgi:hypothetical protein
LKARTRATRRRTREAPFAGEPAVTAPATDADLRTALDDAIDRLPRKYRVPVVLCYLQGLTQARAAEQLGCPPATVATRLARARAQLRTRLVRRGIAPSVAASAAALAPETSAFAPPALVRATAAAARAVADGTVVSAVPASILTLTEGVGITMLLHSWKATLAAAVTLGVAGVAAWKGETLAADGPGQPPAQAAAPAEPKADPPTPAAPPVGRHVYRSTNFTVEAPTAEVAEQFGKAAEEHRKQQALAWLGQEMPPWPKPCPLKVTPKMGGSGAATTFTYDNHGGYDVLAMTVEGETERMLRSALPHEVTHTVLAHYFRSPIPRWADEGAAVLAEDDADRRNYDRIAQDLPNTGKALPLRRLLAVREYGEVGAVVPLHVQGYTVARFLVGRKDRPTFLRFVRQGMVDGWDAAAKECYGFESVEQLEAAWLQTLKSESGSVAGPARPPVYTWTYRGTTPDEAPRSAKPPGPEPTATLQFARALVDGEGRLYVQFWTTVYREKKDERSGTATAIYEAAPHMKWQRYPLIDVHAFRTVKSALEEVELRRLAELLRQETTVVVVPAGLTHMTLGMFLGAIKDGTIVLSLPPGKATATGPVTPPNVPITTFAPPAAPVVPASPPTRVPPPGEPPPAAPANPGPPGQDPDDRRQVFSFWLGFFN